MGTARDLVVLEALLRGRSDIDLFAVDTQDDLGQVPGAVGLLSRMARTAPFDPPTVMRLCLQALRIQQQESAPCIVGAELVATLPPGLAGIARPHERILREMIGPHAKEIIVLGYELTDRDVLGLLASAAKRGAEVIIICDRGRGSARRVREAWPSGAGRPRIFHDRDRLDAAPYSSMHAKCLLVDGTDLLVTSANFTFHGLHGNIELGVRLCGPPAAEARRIFSHLVEHRIVEELY
jgi:phosphatidylserine/phosphatidylglycerophosphate/cardiolipin synthase-like enzyme